MTTNIRETARNTSEFAAPLPAGTYLVGDPCYAVGYDAPQGDLWGAFLSAAWEGCDANRVKILEATVLGHRVAASGTAYGDGTYRDGAGNEYGVDAGLLGAVPVALARLTMPGLAGLGDDELAERLGMVATAFGRPFHVGYDDGWVNVGHVTINTGDDADGDEDGCGNCGEFCEDGMGRDCMNQPDEDED